MSGSGSGVTTCGSSPGCQLSMLSAGAPSEELPKKQARGLDRETVARRDRLQRNDLGSLQIVERLRLKRQRDIVLRQRRRAQRFLQLRIERQAVLRRGLGGFGAPHRRIRGRRDPRAPAPCRRVPSSRAADVTRRSPFKRAIDLGENRRPGSAAATAPADCA